MGRVTLSKTFAAGPEAVFDALADFEHAAERVPDITRLEVLTEGPIRVGTRFRETRVVFKRECTEEMEITRFSRPDGLRVECHSCGCHYTNDFLCRPVEDGTDVEVIIEYRPVTLFAKLLSPLSALMKGQIIGCMERDLEAIKNFVESRQPTEG